MRTLLLALSLGVVIGCTGIQPVGPMAKMMGVPPGGKAGLGQGKDKDEPPEPVTVPAVRPTPPLNTTGPEDVNPDDPYLAVGKLQQELEADRQTIPVSPTTVQISRINGAIK
jgi:hypothetical protein